MKTKILLAILLFSLLTCKTVQPPPPTPSPPQNPVPSAVDKPARELELLQKADYLTLILAEVTKDDGLGYGEILSGFLWESPDKRCYIISAAHLVPRPTSERIRKIRVWFYKDVKNKKTKEYEASVFKLDRSRDACLLTINDPNFKFDGELAKFGDSSAVQRNDTVYSLGHPNQVFWSVSKGRVLSTAVLLEGDELTRLLISHSAWGWYGSSGGPLLNENGEVIGMNIRGVGIKEGRLQAILAVKSNDLIELFYKWTNNY